MPDGIESDPGNVVDLNAYRQQKAQKQKESDSSQTDQQPTTGSRLDFPVRIRRTEKFQDMEWGTQLEGTLLSLRNMAGASVEDLQAVERLEVGERYTTEDGRWSVTRDLDDRYVVAPVESDKQ